MADEIITMQALVTLASRPGGGLPSPDLRFRPVAGQTLKSVDVLPACRREPVLLPSAGPPCPELGELPGGRRTAFR